MVLQRAQGGAQQGVDTAFAEKDGEPRLGRPEPVGFTGMHRVERCDDALAQRLPMRRRDRQHLGGVVRVDAEHDGAFA